MIYRKWGRVVRWENGTLVRVEEAGEAREENGLFLAGPIGHSVILSGEDGERARARVRSIAGETLRCAQDDVGVERLLVTDGVALHEYNGVRWTEETRRVHVALARRPWRVLVDDAALVARVAAALARCEGERDFEHVLVMPHLALDVECEREQQPGGLDGYGRPIERRRVEGEPPNFYRPSYRVRPVRRWLNVRALPFGNINSSAPVAVALVDARRPTALVEHDGRAFVTPLRVDRVTAAGEGGEMLL